jgi:4-hydroxybenzoate polyprenyltransferase
MSHQLALPYWLGLVAAVGFLLYQQVLIHKRERDPCFKAFLNNHYVGLVIFIGIAASLPLPF